MLGLSRSSPTGIAALRRCSSMAQALVYQQHGSPEKVLALEDQTIGQPAEDEVILDILAAPINPSDINQIEGKYPLVPPLPAVAGTEGVAVVRQAGTRVTGMRKGDWVVPLKSGLGTWRSSGVFSAAAWHPVPADLPLKAAATLCINPPTALHMLERFVDLQPGDAVVQNGANSAVGQLVIQMAAAKGLDSINIVRDRPDLAALSERLKQLGATLVTTEDRVKDDMQAANLPRPKLGLNCVGGSAATAVAKCLARGGTMVTYGGMSMKPVCMPTSLFIFKDLRLRGFWLSGGTTGAKAYAINTVAQMYQQGLLQSPLCEKHSLSDFTRALTRAQESGRNTKVLLSAHQ